MIHLNPSKLLPAAALLFAATIAAAVYSEAHSVKSQLPSEGTEPRSLTERLLPAPKADSLTLLVMGLDSAEGLTDVVMVARLDNIEKKALLLQLPRDLYVGEAGGVTGKLNGVYRAGGAPAVKRLLFEQMGLEVDYYAVVEMAAVRDLVDDLGGVTVDLSQRISYLPGRYLEPGRQTINGEQAEWLIRTRNSYTDGDLGRMRTHIMFLSGLMRAAKQQGAATIAAIAAKYHSRVKTDVPLDVLLSQLPVMLSLGSADINTLDVPLYKFAMQGEYAVFVAHRRKLAALLEEHMGVSPGAVVTSWGPPEEIESQSEAGQPPVWDGVFNSPDWSQVGNKLG